MTRKRHRHRPQPDRIIARAEPGPLPHHTRQHYDVLSRSQRAGAAISRSSIQNPLFQIHRGDPEKRIGRVCGQRFPLQNAFFNSLSNATYILWQKSQASSFGASQLEDHSMKQVSLSVMEINQKRSVPTPDFSIGNRQNPWPDKYWQTNSIDKTLDKETSALFLCGLNLPMDRPPWHPKIPESHSITC